MKIQSIPVGLLKTISTEPWRPKMYNTNHGWHLLTAQVIAANNLHGEHCNHKQPVKRSSRSLSGPLQYAGTARLSELSGLFHYLPARSNKFNCGLWAESCERRTMGKCRKKEFWGKGWNRAAFKNHSGIDVGLECKVACTFYAQVCLSWKRHACRIVAATLSETGKQMCRWRRRRRKNSISDCIFHGNNESN